MAQSAGKRVKWGGLGEPAIWAGLRDSGRGEAEDTLQRDEWDVAGMAMERRLCRGNRPAGESGQCVRNPFIVLTPQRNKAAALLMDCVHSGSERARRETVAQPDTAGH